MMQMNKTFIIAEAGVNHNGDMQLAKELIYQAAKIGADAIKFQTFSADKIVHPNTPKAEYQKKEKPNENQYELLKRLELSPAAHYELKDIADKNNIQFLSTPFDLDSLEFLIGLDLPYIKISSGDLTFGPLLLKAAQNNKKVLISTGMATLDEITAALYVLAYGYQNPKAEPKSYQEIKEFSQCLNLREVLYEQVVLFHCTSEYPAPLDEINLNVLETFKKQFGLKLGYSDHSTGILVPALAVAKGASVIEKHFTIDNALEGPDHQASLNVTQFSEMIKQIRLTETILGSDEKKPTMAELKNKAIVRKGVYAATKMAKGEIINKNNLSFLRPESKLSPMDAWNIINTPVKHDIILLEEF